MAIFSRGSSIQTLSAGAACLEIVGNPGDLGRIFELGVSLASAPGATSTFGIGIPGTSGSTLNFLTGVNEDVPSIGDNYPQLVTSWAVAPTTPSKFMRRCTLDNVIGDIWVFQFPKGLIFPNQMPANSLVLWNITAVGQAETWVVWGD